MNVAPTLDGRLRIDLEGELDLMILQSIVTDASSGDTDLAARLGDLMETGLEEDWMEFVIPDLRESFNEQLSMIAKSLVGADADTRLFIERPEADGWYGGLNQARMALEQRFGFDTRDEEDMTPEVHSAKLRYRFYQAVQELLLQFVMKP